jgi:hypothetical protein
VIEEADLSRCEAEGKTGISLDEGPSSGTVACGHRGGFCGHFLRCLLIAYHEWSDATREWDDEMMDRTYRVLDDAVEEAAAKVATTAVDDDNFAFRPIAVDPALVAGVEWGT